MWSTGDHSKRNVFAPDVPLYLHNECSFHQKVNNLSSNLLAEIINYFFSLQWQSSIPQKEYIPTFFPSIVVELMKTPPKMKTSWHLSHCTWYLKNMLRILQMILLRSFLTLQENLEYLQCTSNTMKLTSVKKNLNLEKFIQCQFWKY